MRYPAALGGQDSGVLAEVLWREATSYVCAGISSAHRTPYAPIVSPSSAKLPSSSTNTAAGRQR